jgi:hypothetical protein
MEAITVQRQRMESLGTIPMGCIAFSFAYFSFEIETFGFFTFFSSGIVLIAMGVYPFLTPLASLENGILSIYCRPFKKIQIDLDSIKSVHSSGPGIYPKYFHFKLDSGTTSFNPNYSLIQNDGMVLKRFLESIGTDIEHNTETK